MICKYHEKLMQGLYSIEKVGVGCINMDFKILHRVVFSAKGFKQSEVMNRSSCHYTWDSILCRYCISTCNFFGEPQPSDFASTIHCSVKPCTLDVYCTQKFHTFLHQSFKTFELRPYSCDLQKLEMILVCKIKISCTTRRISCNISEKFAQQQK